MAHNDENIGQKCFFCRFQQFLGLFSTLIAEGFSETGPFMRFSFFSKCPKFNENSKNAIKKQQNVFGLFCIWISKSNCLWIGKFSLLWPDACHRQSTVNKNILTNFIYLFIYLYIYSFKLYYKENFSELIYTGYRTKLYI